MLINIVKIATKVLLTNPKARELTKKVLKKAYTEAKPIVNKNGKILKDTISETSPIENPIKFVKTLKNNIKNN